MAIKAALTAPKVAKALKRLDASPLAEHFDASVARVTEDMVQVCFAVSRALVANALGCAPSDEQVDGFMSEVIQNPAAPWRAYRLLGEMKKSANQRRRVFLAAMLFGLPFSTLPDDDRDRVDMVVERMLPADAALLLRIAENPGCALYRDRHNIRLTRANAGPNDSAEEMIETILGSSPEDLAAVTSLVSLGCAELGTNDPAKSGPFQETEQGLRVTERGPLEPEDQWYRLVKPTPLGLLVIRAITAVRPGVDAEL